MPIKVSNNTNPSAVLASSYAAGVGKERSDIFKSGIGDYMRNQSRVVDRLHADANAAADRKLRSDYMKRSSESTRRGGGRSSQPYVSKFDAQVAQHQADARYKDRAVFDSDIRKSEAEHGNRLEQDNAYLENDLAKDNYSYELSEKQIAEHNKLSDVYESARKSGDFSADELQEIRRDIVAEQSGIEPFARARKKSQYQPGQDVGETWESDDGQFVLSRDKDGNVKKIADTGRVPTAKELAEYAKVGVSALSAEGAALDPEKLSQFVDGMVSMRQKYSGKDGAAQGAGQATAKSRDEELRTDKRTGQVMPRHSETHIVNLLDGAKALGTPVETETYKAMGSISDLKAQEDRETNEGKRSALRERRNREMMQFVSLLDLLEGKQQQ